MKKTIFALLIVVLLFAFVACDNQTSIQGPSNAIIDDSVELYTVGVSNEYELRIAISNPIFEAIQLEGDITLTNKIEIGSNRKLVLDLNTFSLDCAGKTIIVGGNANITIKDDSNLGRIYTNGSYPLCVTDNASLIIEGGTIGSIDSTYGICAFNNSTLVINDGNIMSGDTAIATNNLTQPNDGTKSYVSVQINGGTIDAPVGIFYSSLGSLTIGAEATIRGTDLVVVKGGTVKIDENATLISIPKLVERDNIAKAINWNNGWDAAIGADIIIVFNPNYAAFGSNTPFNSIEIGAKDSRRIIVAVDERYDEDGGGVISDEAVMKYVVDEGANLFKKN